MKPVTILSTFFLFFTFFVLTNVTQQQIKIVLRKIVSNQKKKKKTLYMLNKKRKSTNYANIQRVVMLAVVFGEQYSYASMCNGGVRRRGRERKEDNDNTV